VVTGSACDETHPPASPDDVEVALESTEVDRPGVKVDTPSHRVYDGLGLLVDLLLHEVIELALHDLSELDLERLDRSDGGHAIVSSESVDVELCRQGKGSVRLTESALAAR
jgi:hypothetical protein